MREGQDVVGVKVGLMWRYQQEAGPIIIQLGYPGPAQWIIQVSRAIIIQLQQPVATKPAGPMSDGQAEENITYLILWIVLPLNQS